MIRSSVVILALRFAAGAAALLPSGLAAQRVDPSRIIDLHVNAESENRAFDGSVVEGQRFRVSIAGRGTYEILPILIDGGADRFRVTVFAGPEGAEGAALRAAGTVDARRGVPVALPGMPSTSLVIDGVRRADGAAARQAGFDPVDDPVRTLLARGLQETCCVQCGNITACGCRVVHTCDSCCRAPCCRAGETRGAPAPNPIFPRFARFAGACGKPIRDAERLFTPRLFPARIAFAR